jgi:hypothetical protein
MKALTKSDWMEIYYAVKYKKETSPATFGDSRWIKQLDSIMKKIGPDGENMTKEER